MLRMRNRFTALSFKTTQRKSQPGAGNNSRGHVNEEGTDNTLGTQRAQLEQRTGFTVPRPLRFLPLLRRFLVMFAVEEG
jgi:hypothetical protein